MKLLNNLVYSPSGLIIVFIEIALRPQHHFPFYGQCRTFCDLASNLPRVE